MTNQAGTYNFGEFTENKKELDRLIRQAKIGLELEKNILLASGLRQGMSVLDIACGPGIIACEIANMVYPASVTGLDISEKLIQTALYHKSESKTNNVNFLVGNAYALPFADNSFDFVYARFVFQHLEFPKKVIENIFRVLKPGGILCITDIDDSWLTLYPTSEAFISLTETAAQYQKDHGGDRFVGRKLGLYLHEGKFSEVKTKIVPVTTHDIGLKDFLDITTGFKHEQASKKSIEKGKADMESIYQIQNEPYAWGAVGVFIATGTKP